MAKNRTQLEEEATVLGIDFSGFETNAQFQEAISAKKAESKEDEETNPVNTDTDSKNPQDNQENVEAPMNPKGKAKKEKGVTVETTREVAFNINGEKQEGTMFTFESEEIAEARKKMLVERYGVGVIKE